MTSVLGYWPIRGRAGQIRLILHYVGEGFEDKIYPYGPAPGYSKDNWFKEKYSVGLPLPNLPYYMSGDIRISQSVAIERYLARKYKLESTTETDIIRQDNILYTAVDLQNELIHLAYHRDFEYLRDEYVTKMKGKLKQLSDLLGNDDWFVGSKINFVDFHVYESISINSQLEPSCLDEYSKLQLFLYRIESLPKVKEYLSSSGYVKEAITSGRAQWGYVV